MSTNTVFFFLLLLGLALPALSAKCPDPKKMPTTCECEDISMMRRLDIDLTCKGTTLVELKDALSLMDKDSKLQVQLEEMTLDPLPSDIFDGWNVVSLYITHCQLDSLSYPGQLALSGLEDKLEVLVISASFIEEKPLAEFDLGHLNRLRDLEFLDNSIPELGDDWFANGPISLNYLVFKSNGIAKVGEKAFANLENLTQLTIVGNSFSQLKRSALPRPAERLQFLNLNNNELRNLPDDLFSDMPALMSLFIQTNGIVSLSETTFKSIWPHLIMFDVGGNRLECDSSMEWLFQIQTKAVVLGTCVGPNGRKKLDEFIKNKGKLPRSF